MHPGLFISPLHRASAHHNGVYNLCVQANNLCIGIVSRPERGRTRIRGGPPERSVEFERMLIGQRGVPHERTMGLERMCRQIGHEKSSGDGWLPVSLAINCSASTCV